MFGKNSHPLRVVKMVDFGFNNCTVRERERWKDLTVIYIIIILQGRCAQLCFFAGTKSKNSKITSIVLHHYNLDTFTVSLM
jgi:hypothetical protein